jgi:hypothetical protein
VVSDDELRQIARKGICYRNEARDMAIELLELRQKLQEPKPWNDTAFNPYTPP